MLPIRNPIFWIWGVFYSVDGQGFGNPGKQGEFTKLASFAKIKDFCEFSLLFKGKHPESSKKSPLWYVEKSRHVVRAILSVRPNCSHRCVSLKEFPLKIVLILKHVTRISTEQTSTRTKWFKHLECRKWGFKRWGFKQIWGYLRKKAFFLRFLDFPGALRTLRKRAKKAEDGRKRLISADFREGRPDTP